MALSRRRIFGGLLILIKSLRGLAFRIPLWAFPVQILIIPLLRPGHLVLGGRESFFLESLALPVGAHVVPDLAVFVVDVREGLVDDRCGGLLVLALHLAELFQLKFDEIKESFFAPLAAFSLSTSAFPHFSRLRLLSITCGRGFRRLFVLLVGGRTSSNGGGPVLPG